jgi:hypothetical protein
MDLCIKILNVQVAFGVGNRQPGLHGSVKHTICIREHLQKWYGHIPRPKAISIPFLLQTIPNKHSFLAAEFTEPLENMDLCLHFCLLLVEHF